MWFLLQPLIATNAHWHWAPNGYLASGIAGAIAFALTALFSAGATAQEMMTSKEPSAPERRLIQEVKDSRPVTASFFEILARLSLELRLIPA
jgi:hypothetical protein